MPSSTLLYDDNVSTPYQRASSSIYSQLFCRVMVYPQRTLRPGTILSRTAATECGNSNGDKEVLSSPEQLLRHPLSTAAFGSQRRSPLLRWGHRRNSRQKPNLPT